ncbi:MAG: hypothetical protein LBH70_01990 [Spirochaetaceae bacterium]|nr:hypothetical protein [Spirochaetaceae bacterium]
MRLGMKTRREIYEAHYRRYQRAGKHEKGEILDEVAGTTGLNRDHLAHVLSSYGKEQGARVEGQAGVGEARQRRRKREPGKRGGRPARYQDPAFVALVTRLWEDHGRPCGRKRSFRNCWHPCSGACSTFWPRRKSLSTASAMSSRACWQRSAAPNSTGCYGPRERSWSFEGSARPGRRGLPCGPKYRFSARFCFEASRPL